MVPSLDDGSGRHQLARFYAPALMSLAELEEAARAAVDALAWSYLTGGAGDEITVAENGAAWKRLRLRPHMLRDVSRVSTATTVLGTAIALPVMSAPTAMHRLVHADGELATARGVADAG